MPCSESKSRYLKLVQAKQSNKVVVLDDLTLAIWREKSHEMKKNYQVNVSSLRLVIFTPFLYLDVCILYFFFISLLSRSDTFYAQFLFFLLKLLNSESLIREVTVARTGIVPPLLFHFVSW